MRLQNRFDFLRGLLIITFISIVFTLSSCGKDPIPAENQNGHTPDAAAISPLITGGSVGSFAIVNGIVKYWGGNYHGEFGNGSTTSSNTPVHVPGIPGDVQSISPRNNHTCILKDGEVLCSGYNRFGSLGDGTTQDNSTLVKVPGLGSGVTAISAGGYHTCAQVSDKIMCWGENGYGQLGDGTQTQRNSPVQTLGVVSLERDI